METAQPGVDLRKLRSPIAGQVTLNDGSVHDVLQTKSRHYHALRTASAQDATDRIFGVAREVVPSMTETQAGDLTLDEANAIIAFASGGVAMVGALYPNVPSPEQVPTSPG